MRYENFKLDSKKKNIISIPDSNHNIIVFRKYKTNLSRPTGTYTIFKYFIQLQNSYTLVMFGFYFIFLLLQLLRCTF